MITINAMAIKSRVITLVLVKSVIFNIYDNNSSNELEVFYCLRSKIT